jgi:hypothetical protein
MAKITTADCVDFLVKCAEEFHPTMSDTCETAEEYAALSPEQKLKSSHALLTNPKLWKRMKKFSPKGYWEKIGFGIECNAWDMYNPPMREEDIKSIRWFSNGPAFSEDDEYDVGLPGHNERHIYEVYEMKDGTLILGDNFGD